MAFSVIPDPPEAVSLSEGVTVWLPGRLLGVHQTVISDQLHFFDIFNASNDAVISLPNHDLRNRFDLWSNTAGILVEAAKGGVDDMFPNTSSVVREIAMTQLLLNAEDFRGWVERGFDKDFSLIGKTNVEFLKRVFAELGSPEGYEVDVFQLANDFGEALAEEAINEVSEIREGYKGAETRRINRKKLGWAVPLTVGLIIAVGAALGY